MWVVRPREIFARVKFSNCPEARVTAGNSSMDEPRALVQSDAARGAHSVDPAE